MLPQGHSHHSLNRWADSTVRPIESLADASRAGLQLSLPQVGRNCSGAPEDGSGRPEDSSTNRTRVVAVLTMYGPVMGVRDIRPTLRLPKYSFAHIVIAVRSCLMSHHRQSSRLIC